MAEGDLSEVADLLTRCLICGKELVSPTWLPCLHTFCSTCLGGKDLQGNSTSVSCPMCGKFFPATELRADYFIQDLVEGHRIVQRGSGKTTCEFCDEESSPHDDEGQRDKTGTSLATMHCIECRRNLCTDCTRGHRKHCKTHLIVDIEDVQQRRKSVSQSTPRCRQHPEEKLKIFCCDCRVVLCVVCYAEGHHAHACKDILNTTSDLQRLLKEESEWIDICASGLSSTLTDLEKQWNSYEDSVKDARLRIRDKGDLLKRIIDAHLASLYKELDAITESSFKEFRQSTKMLEDMMTDLNYIKKYSLVLVGLGSPSHLANSYHRLHAKAAEVKSRRLEMNGFVLKKPEVVFAKPDSVERITGETNKVIGTVTLNQARTEEKENDRDTFVELLGTLSTEGRGVTGVTILNNKLYVTCAWTNTIFVHDADRPFAKHPSILVKELRCPNDVASCTDNCCIYVVDSDNSCVFRVTPAGQSDVWLSKTSQPWTISVNRGRVLLATDGKQTQLNIYSSGASSLNRIRLPAAILSIQHAVELSNGHFVVAHGRDSGHIISKISEISTKGTILRSFDGGTESNGPSTTMTTLVKWPKHLAIDGHDRVLVAEFSNHYVLVLNSHFQLERMLLSWDRDQVDAPSRLCYVPGTAVLLLAEATSVKVFYVRGLRSEKSPRGALKRFSLFNTSKK